MSQTDQKVALVTGASRGIGSAIATSLAQRGMMVVGTATSEQGAASISAHLSEWGGVGRVLNVTDPDSIAACLESVRTELGDPLVLVNNAGITQDNLLMRMKEDEWHSVVDTNLNALYRLCKGCLRGMTKSQMGQGD
jgi:3-oxoacyl-[acyl-carrier protein] reductase